MSRLSVGWLRRMSVAAHGRPVYDVYALPSDELQKIVRALPVYADDDKGRHVVAVNLAFLGRQDKLRAALRCGGWFEVGDSIWGDFKQGLAEVRRGEPLEHFPPFTVFRIAGRHQDLNEARATSWTSRHHFRVWHSTAVDSMARAIWPAAGDYDESVRWSSLDHVADPKIDVERDYIADTLRHCPNVESLTLVENPALPPRSFDGRTHFITDRRVLVVELR